MRAASALLLSSMALTGCQWLADIDQKARPDGAGGAATTSSSSAGGAGGAGGQAGASSGPAGGGGSGGSGGSGGQAGAGGGAPPPCLTMCGDQCTDTTSDPKHCGSCSVACSPSVSCDAGICGRSLFRGAGSDSPSAVKANGSLWSWGGDTYLQAAIGYPMGGIAEPKHGVLLEETARYAASTGYTTCVMLTSGGVSCFGSATYGQVGNATLGGGPDACSDENGCVGNPFATIASGVAELTGAGWWTGGSHFCARKKTGTVSCWGDLGSCGPTNGWAMPLPISGVHHAVQLAAGAGFTCALLADGTISCWGANCHGELGQGDLDAHEGAVRVPGLSGVTVIGAGISHVCARAADGVYCWGYNSTAQLGVGAANDQVAVPMRVLGPEGFDDVVQIVGGAEATCALTAAGLVFCWGRGDYGIAGDGTMGSDPCPSGTSTCLATPRRADVTDVVEIAIGDATALARTRDGKLWAWGSGGLGQLGNATSSGQSASPVQVHHFP